jgi:hypothetical protein
MDFGGRGGGVQLGGQQMVKGLHILSPLLIFISFPFSP